MRARGQCVRRRAADERGLRDCRTPAGTRADAAHGDVRPLYRPAVCSVRADAEILGAGRAVLARVDGSPPGRPRARCARRQGARHRRVRARARGAHAARGGSARRGAFTGLTIERSAADLQPSGAGRASVRSGNTAGLSPEGRLDVGPPGCHMRVPASARPHESARWRPDNPATMRTTTYAWHPFSRRRARHSHVGRRGLRAGPGILGVWWTTTRTRAGSRS